MNTIRSGLLLASLALGLLASASNASASEDRPRARVELRNWGDTAELRIANHNRPTVYCQGWISFRLAYSGRHIDRRFSEYVQGQSTRTTRFRAPRNDYFADAWHNIQCR